MFTTDHAVETWYAERTGYDYAEPLKNFAKTGMFTQMVWKGSTKMGCGIKDKILVCHYCPGGNFIGRFEKNVLRPAGATEDDRCDKS